MRRVSLARPEFQSDGTDPERYRAAVMRCGQALGARDTGASYYDGETG